MLCFSDINGYQTHHHPHHHHPSIANHSGTTTSPSARIRLTIFLWVSVVTALSTQRIIIMKISNAAVVALTCISSSRAFVSTSSHIQKPIGTTTELNLQVDKHAWIGPTTTLVVGLTLVSQVAGAAPVETASLLEPPIVPFMQQGKHAPHNCESRRKSEKIRLDQPSHPAVHLFLRYTTANDHAFGDVTSEYDFWIQSPVGR
jgi:hypothetical protein